MSGGSGDSAAGAEKIPLISLERPPCGRPVEIGEMVAASAVQASNVLKDVRENLTNLVGGKMARYETLLDMAVERATAALRAKLRAEGYDGALGVRMSHPNVVSGGAEVILYGTGFRWAQPASPSARSGGETGGAGIV